MATAAATFVMSLGNGTDGDILAHGADNTFLFHSSGSTVGAFEKINLTTNTVTAINNLSMTETYGMGYCMSNSVLYETDNQNNMFRRNTANGVRTLIGVIPAPSLIRGLAVFVDIVNLE